MSAITHAQAESWRTDWKRLTLRQVHARLRSLYFLADFVMGCRESIPLPWQKFLHVEIGLGEDRREGLEGPGARERDLPANPVSTAEAEAWGLWTESDLPPTERMLEHAPWLADEPPETRKIRRWFCVLRAVQDRAWTNKPLERDVELLEQALAIVPEELWNPWPVSPETLWGKNRDGRTGRVKATFNIRKLRFDGAEENPSTAQVWRDHSEPREKEND